MGVAVLGGGFQGCCVAIELAMRGVRVTLYERNSALLAGAATANEGKIHLGYTYASDRSLNTARTLLSGALSFAPHLKRYLGADAPLSISEPFTYVVHRDSQVAVEDIAAYLHATHSLIATLPNAGGYFGVDLRAAPRRLTQAALERRFNPTFISAAFDTPEIAIDTIAIANSIRQRIAQDPLIDVRTNRVVTAVEDDRAYLRVRSTGIESNDRASDTFSTVVNALWDGRLAIDATRGLQPDRKWLHRLKYGIRFRLVDKGSLPSVTIVLGPFGDLVAYGGGSYYLSWYPACMTAHTSSLAPPTSWRALPDGAYLSRIAAKSFAAMGTIVPSFTTVRPKEITVRSGAIVAWGSSDIDDRSSELHRRYDIGVNSSGGYHSIDPGKLTMTPHFAHVCADRIMVKSSP